MIPANFSIDIGIVNDVKQLLFEEQIAVVYANASKVLYDFFANPESFVYYEASKSIVSDIVEIIIHDDFTLQSIQNIMEHGYHTHTHSINVAIYAISFGHFLNLTIEELNELGEAALLHDLGKSKVDTLIVNKNGKLTYDEFEEMKNHPSLGHTIALKLGIQNIKVQQGIKQHHEKIDGSGYPHGLKGGDISFYARIICLCDIFDALTSRRTYKEPMTYFEAFVLIENEMNGCVDSVLLQKMMELLG